MGGWKGGEGRFVLTVGEIGQLTCDRVTDKCKYGV